MRDVAAELLDLLATERALLVRGCFDDLDRLAVQKELLMRELARDTPPHRIVAPLRNRAEANARLLGAAAAGLRAAIDRISSARGAGPALETYAADGSRKRLGRPRPQHERRA